MSSYAQPDSFGSTPGLPIAVNPGNGLAYALGFDNTTSPPTPVWTLVSSWARAKQKLSATSWAVAKTKATSWAAAKAIVGS